MPSHTISIHLVRRMEVMPTLYFARIFFSDSDSREFIERITSATPKNNNNNNRFNCLFTRISIWHEKRIYGNSACDESTQNEYTCFAAEPS